jgi:predicted ATP-binding protein involved in virulence
MRLISIELTDYRGIPHEVFEFPAGPCAVLFGTNGAGKTTVLDAVAAMMRPYVNMLCSFPLSAENSAVTDEPKSDPEEVDADSHVITASDIRTGKAAASCAVTVSFKDDNPLEDPGSWVTWKATRTKAGARDEMTDDFDIALAVAVYLRDEVIADIQAGQSRHDIPIVVYYPTERTIIDIPLRIRKRHDFSHQLAALEGALHRRSQDFKVLFEWFRNREDLENERRLDGNPDYRDRELEAVRRAIPAMLPGFSDLRIKRLPLRMEIRKAGETLFVNQLSHGEKCLLALFADLARRLAIANPSLSDPLQGHALVLIDEIELHLHPRWQREIVDALTRTFPHCQFLLSTHSPQVLSEIPNDQIFMLDQPVPGQTKLYRGSLLFGRDTNQILAAVMDVAERPVEVRGQLERVFDLIALNEFREARAALADLEAMIGRDEPELDRVRTLLAAKEP